MRLSVLNVSPRREKGNTARLLTAFLRGVTATGPHTVTSYLTADVDDDATALAPFDGTDVVLVAFPLYVYSLPAGALRWIARLEGQQKALRDLTQGREVTLAFLTQFGFREACHARGCERQLKRLCAALGFRYGGTVIKGASEGFGSWPSAVQKDYLARFEALGNHFGSRNGTFEQARLDAFSAPEHGSSHWYDALGNRLFAWIGNQMFWKPQLVKHGALAREKDQPLLGVSTLEKSPS